MKWLVLALCVLGELASAQGTADPYEVINTLPDVNDDDFGPEIAHLSAGINQGRLRGFDHPDWGLPFAMLADLYRNTKDNPAYALRLTEEGLEVSAPWGKEAEEVVSILNSSRAYALADLGRYAEAVELATLALPLYRAGLGDELADSFAAEIEVWKQGLPTDSNFDTLALARKAMNEAGLAVDKGDYGRALMLASGAMLPPETMIDPEEQRRLTAEGSMIMGRALYQLGRPKDALVVLEGGIEAAIDLNRSRLDRKPIWRQDPAEGSKRMASLFMWYGRAAMDLGQYSDADWGFEISDQLTTDPKMRPALLYARARLMQLQGDEAGSRARLYELADQATQRGDLAEAGRARFYASISQVREYASEQNLRALITTTDALIAGLADDPFGEGDFFLSEAAYFLVNYDVSNQQAYVYAKRALDIRQSELGRSTDSDLGTEQIARETQGLVATFLLAANNEASRLPEARCSTEEGMGCVIIVENP